MSDHQQKGTKVNHAEHNAKTPSDKTGIFATLRALLRIKGTSAPALIPALAVSSFAGSTSGSRALFGRVFACLLVFGVFAGSSAPLAGAAVSPKGITGFFGVTGTGPGQMTTPRGIAVNQASGNVYAVDSANNRIVLFDSNGNFLRAFGQDVVASGPDQSNEIQTLIVGAASGNFTLTYGGLTTGNISATATAAEVQTALDGLGSISKGGGSVAVSGGPGSASGSAPYKIAFNGGPLARTDVAQIVATNVSLVGGIPSTSVTTETSNPGEKGFEVCVPASGDFCKAGVVGVNGGAMSTLQGIAINQASNDVYVTDQGNRRVQQFDSNGNFLRAFGQDVVAAGSPDNSSATSAVQTLTVTATGGKYTLAFQGKETAELDFNSTAAQIQTALTGLTSIGSGNVAVSETAVGVFKITFTGNLANNPEPLILATSGPVEALAGGTATVINTTTGATGYEVCVAASNDICQQGSNSVSTGGAFGTAMGYLTVAPVGSPNAGDVLVADPANLRVQEFGASGAFVRAFGFDVAKAGPDNIGSSFEVCIATNFDVCKVGVAGSGSGQFATATPTRVVEDASGNVYTVEPTTNFRVQKFTLPSNVVTPQGAYDAADLTGTASTAPVDVAIDPATKDVLIAKVFAAGATPSCPVTGAPSVEERRVLEIDPTLNAGAGGLAATHMTCAGINANVNGLDIRASSSTGNVYVASTTTESRLYVLNAGQPAAPTVGLTNISDVTAHSARITGIVNPNGPTGLAYGLHTTYQINYKRSSDSTFIGYPLGGADAGHGATNLIVAQQLLGLEANTSYDVQIVASKGLGSGSATTSTFSFTTSAAVPDVSTPSAVAAAAATTAIAALHGTISPNSQSTTYRFEYGVTTAYESKAPAPDAAVGSGVTSVPVRQTINGLLPNTVYHFRLVATNPTGVKASSDRMFKTPPLGSALPDNRGIELVSPPDKHPQGYVEEGPLTLQLSYQAAENGQSVFFPIVGGLADTTAGGQVNYVASRSSSGWTSTQLSPPSLISSQSGGAPNYFNFSSSDLSCQVLESPSPLTADTPKVDQELSVYNLYRRNADGTFTLLTNRVPSNASSATNVGGIWYGVAGVSADCNQVFFRTTYRFLPGIPSELYEWDNGVLRDAGLLPNGVAPAPTTAGFGGRTGTELKRPTINVVSPDGSFVFNAPSNEGGDTGKTAVFVRRGPDSVIDISQRQGGSKENAGANYELASKDGSHIFFTANYGLTKPIPNGLPTTCPVGGSDVTAGEGCDLYDYDVSSGQLTDLTMDSNPLDVKGAGVGGVVAASEDGTYVYFVAQGQLVSGRGNTYAQNVSESKRNLYLAHAGSLTYITTLLTADFRANNANPSGDSSGDLIRIPKNYSAQASADGHTLLFTSATNVVGYSNPIGGSGNEFEEAYLYSADTDTTVCLSCRFDGLPTIGSGQREGGVVYLGHGTNPVRSVWTEQEMTYRHPRSLSSNGNRAFFTMPDALAPGAVEGAFNLYEWQEGQLRVLRSTPVGPLGNKFGFVDSSASGDDVFIRTDEQLTGYDYDFMKDIYDIRVDGGFPEPLAPPAPCDPTADQCQGAPAQLPGPSSPVSEGFAGPGNPPVFKPKRHKQKPKRHKQTKPHGHRKSHPKQKKAHKRGHRSSPADSGGAK